MNISLVCKKGKKAAAGPSRKGKKKNDQAKTKQLRGGGVVCMVLSPDTGPFSCEKKEGMGRVLKKIRHPGHEGVKSDEIGLGRKTTPGGPQKNKRCPARATREA